MANLPDMTWVSALVRLAATVRSQISARAAKTWTWPAPGHKLPPRTSRGIGPNELDQYGHAIDGWPLGLGYPQATAEWIPGPEGHQAWPDFFKTEGILQDRGEPGFDSRFGNGYPMVDSILAYLIDPEWV